MTLLHVVLRSSTSRWIGYIIPCWVASLPIFSTWPADQVFTLSAWRIWVTPAMASITRRLQLSMLLPQLNGSDLIAITIARIFVRQNSQTEIDLVMLIYGEFNVFRPVDIGKILDKSWQALKPGGVLLLEPHSYRMVKKLGKQVASWYSSTGGLFFDSPHLVTAGELLGRRLSHCHHPILCLTSGNRSGHPVCPKLPGLSGG